MINLVRIPSETPNIQPADDCRMFKYAVGGIDGYVRGYGQECSYVVNGREFTIQSGEIVADGYQVSIDSNGASLTVISSSSLYYYTVYAEIDLRVSDSPAVSVKASYSLTEYPTIDVGDNLTANMSGVHRVPLYQFDVLNGNISNVEKVLRGIDYISQDTIAEIHSRLDALGFKTGIADLESPDGSVISTSRNSLLKQGKQIVFKFSTEYSVMPQFYIRIPEDFRPGEDSEVLVALSSQLQYSSMTNFYWYKVSASTGYLLDANGSPYLFGVPNTQVAVSGGWVLP